MIFLVYLIMVDFNQFVCWVILFHLSIDISIYFHALYKYISHASLVTVINYHNSVGSTRLGEVPLKCPQTWWSWLMFAPNSFNGHFRYRLIEGTYVGLDFRGYAPKRWVYMVQQLQLILWYFGTIFRGTISHGYVLKTHIFHINYSLSLDLVYLQLTWTNNATQ